MGELSRCPSCNRPVRWYPTNCLEARRLTGDSLRSAADRAIAKVKRGL